MLRRILPVALAAALALTASGCIEKESDRQLPHHQADQAEAAVTLDAGTGQTCLSPGSYLYFESARVDAEVTFTGAEAVATGAGVRQAWIAPAPGGDQAQVSGISAYDGEEHALPRTSAERSNWAERKPLAGAHVTPGDYYVFLLVDGSEGDSFERLDVTWEAGEEHGTASIRDLAKFRSDCPASIRPVGLRTQDGAGYEGCVAQAGPVMVTYPFEALTATRLDEVHVHPELRSPVRAWVSRVDSDRDLISSTGWPGGLSVAERTQLNWDARVKATGAELARGRYVLFALVDLTAEDEVDHLELEWTSGQDHSSVDVAARVTAGDCER